MNEQNNRPDPWSTDPGAASYNRFDSGSGETGGYGYNRRDNSRNIWYDANYTAGNEAQGFTVPRRAVSVTAKTHKKKGDSAVKLVILCLICALLGGGAGAFVAGSFVGNYERPEVLTVLPPVITPAPAVPSGQNPVNNVNTGDILKGSEIYEMNVSQNVGIKTEVTRTNMFGRPTSAAISGSGFIISPDGYIVTNYHVIETAYEGGYAVSVLTYDGETHAAAIVGFEKDNDVAVLKIDAAGLNSAITGNSDNIKVGDTVYAIGNPLGELSYTMTSGMVSALDREIMTDSNSEPINMFQFDAAVNSGNSGGPVYNDRGEIIGIVTAKNVATGVEGLGFAIPINDAVKIVNELIVNGYVSGKASMGINVMNVPDSAVVYYNMVPGAYVYSVTPGSCADKAGLKDGDVITKLGDAEISSFTELASAKKMYGAGDSAQVTVYREGSYYTYTIVFDEEIPQIRAEAAPNRQYINPFGGYFGQ